MKAMQGSQLLIDISVELCRKLDAMSFSTPVYRVYNPLSYAFSTYREYLSRFTPEKGGVVFLGMNPGPWGMAQTGIPFGTVSMVRNWMKISEEAAAAIGKPPLLHPQKPVQGFDCIREEISGLRFWGLISEYFPNAGNFFVKHLVINYCPLMFLEEGGRNLTPDKKINSMERNILFDACNTALKKTVHVLQPEMLIGIGNFAESRLERLFGSTYSLGKILHPSPASPSANKNWKEKALFQLKEMGICLQRT